MTDYRDSIYKREPCTICKGLKYIEVKSPKYKAVIEPCKHCDNKGFLKILKNDYDY